MDKLARTALACAALWAFGAGTAANAGVVTFDDVALAFQGDGDGLLSGGFRFTQVGDFGGVADAATFGLFGNAPSGNETQYYAGFNDSAVAMTRENGGAFRLGGLAYGFISPLGGGVAPGTEPGALVLQALAADGALYRLSTAWAPADDAGGFAFQVLDFSGLGPLAGADLLSVTFSACAFDGSGDCVAPYLNLNQFAIDDIVLIPEPPTQALAALALIGTGFFASRRQRPAVRREAQA